MAVSHVATGTRSAGGTTSVAPTYPSGVAVNRLALLSRALKPSTATTSTPGAYTEVITATGGTGSQGIDTGPTRVTVDQRVLTGSETGSVTCSQAASPNSCHGVIQIYSISAGASWDVASASGADATHGTGRSVTATTTISLRPGDVVVAVCSSDTDTTTAFTSPAITAAGITFGATTQRLGAGGVTTGNDCGLYIFEATVSTGTATVAPVVTLSGGPSNCGPVAFVRLRQGAVVASVGQVAELEVAQFPQVAKVKEVSQAADAEASQPVSLFTVAQEIDVDWRASDASRITKKLFTVDGAQASSVTVDDSRHEVDVESTAGQLATSNLREALIFEETAGWSDGIVATTFGPRTFYWPGSPDGAVRPQHGISYRYQETASKRKHIAIWQNIIFDVNWSLLVGVWESNLDGTGFQNRQQGKQMDPLFRGATVSASARSNNVVTLTVDNSDDFTVGDPINVDVATASFDGWHFVTGKTATTITYDQVGADESGGAGTAIHVFPYAVEARVRGNVIDVRAWPPENAALKPEWVNLDASAGLVFPGTSGNYVSTPDAAALDITGDFTLWADFTPTTWPPSTNQSLIGKYGTTTPSNQRSYRMRINATTGMIQVQTSTAGTATSVTWTSSVAPTLINGRICIWAVVDVDDAGSKTCRFYQAPTAADFATRTQLGTTNTQAGTTTVFSGTAPVEIGSVNTGTAELFSGRVHAAGIRPAQDTDEPLVAPVADVDGTVLYDGSTSFMSREEARTWTVNGTAAVVNEGLGSNSTLAFSMDIDRVGPEAARIAYPAPVGFGSVGLIAAHLGTSDYSHVTFGPLYARNTVANFIAPISEAGTETETAPAIAALKVAAAGQVTEPETATVVVAVETRAVAEVTESETAQSVAAAKAVVAGAATETDTAQAAAARKTLAVALVTEAESVTAWAGVKVAGVGQAADTEGAQPVGAAKTRQVSAAAETDEAHGVAAAKARALVSAAETDTASVLSVQRVYPVGAVTESDAVQLVTARKLSLLAMAAETDTASAVGAAKIRQVDATAEIEAAHQVTAPGVVNQVLETDAAGSVTAAHVVPVTAAVESDSAPTLTSGKWAAVGQVAEIDLVRAVSALVFAEDPHPQHGSFRESGTGRFGEVGSHGSFREVVTR